MYYVMEYASTGTTQCATLCATESDAHIPVLLILDGCMFQYNEHWITSFPNIISVPF